MSSTTLITIAFVAVAVSNIALSAFLLWQQRAHYEALLRDVRADNLDLRGRMFVSKGQPPPGVDMKEAHEERRAERKERQNDPARKSAPDPTWRMRRRLTENEEKRRAAPSK